MAKNAEHASQILNRPWRTAEWSHSTESGYKIKDAKQMPRNAKIVLGKLQLLMHTLEWAVHEPVVLQRKILKSEWIVLKKLSGCPNGTRFLESDWKEWMLLWLSAKRNQFQVLELWATAPFIVPRAAQGPARPASPYEESNMHGNKLLNYGPMPGKPNS